MARGRVEEEDRRLREQPLAEVHLLLVALAEALDGVTVERAALDAECVRYLLVCRRGGRLGVTSEGRAFAQTPMVD